MELDARVHSRARWTLLIAVSAALITATLHLTAISFARYVLREFTWFSRDVFWMAPAGYLLFFVVAALPLALIAALRPRFLPPHLPVGLFVCLATFTLLLPFTRIHRIAALIFSIGLAIQSARVIGARPHAWEPRLRRLSAALTVTFAAFALGPAAWRTVVVRRALASLPELSGDRPNILLLVLDTVRGDNLGLLGYHRNTTPALSSWARDAVVFENAFSPAPWTFPSHASMFTGLWPRQLDFSRRRPLRGDLTFLAEVLRDQGYVTSAFVANQRFAGYETGLQRGFVHFEDYRRSWRQLVMSTWIGQTDMVVKALRARDARSAFRSLLSLNFWVNASRNMDEFPAGLVADRFLQWHARTPGRPWFTFINFFDAHEPYRPPPPFDTLFNGGREPIDRYDGGIRYIDTAVDRILRSLAQSGELDNTVVVVVADHGEMFGERGLYSHGLMLYHPVLHVPLMIRWPGHVPAGVRVRTAVSLRNVAATILDLADIEQPQSIAGTSMVQWWSDTREPDPDHAVMSELFDTINPDPKTPISRGPMLSVLSMAWQYVRNGDGVEELYRHDLDPAERADLARDPRYGDTLRLMRSKAEAISAPLGPMPWQVIVRQ